jgi:putative hemolysin
VIRVVENATGRLNLIRRANGYEDDLSRGADFWSVMIARYGLELKVIAGTLADIPSTGPLVVVANHPYGMLDGLMMGHILSRVRRGDFRILANNVFRGAEDLDRAILPISFDETRIAQAENLRTRRLAMNYLQSGGAIGVFPGGAVSTSATPFAMPMDPGWRSFTAKMIARSGATVVPIYFEGANSRLFQIASHLHSTLRLAFLIREFSRRTDEPVRVVIGQAIAPADLAALRHDPKAMMDFLRARTYALSPKPLGFPAYGLEFEARHRRTGRDGGRDL